MENFFDAFISYGRADSKAFATELNAKLTAQGLNVWFDQEDIPLAVDFQEQINDGIENAHNFIFVIAPHSVNSPYCLKEIELAAKHNKRIIPLLHVEQISQETWQSRNPDKTEEDWQEYQDQGFHLGNDRNPNMHETIKKINWVNFRENIDDFVISLTGLVETIKKDTDYIQQHSHYLIQALEWERNQKQTNYLLVGEERKQASEWLVQKFDGQSPCIPTDLQCEFISESTKNANNLMTQVFLAYSEQDERIKEKIRKTLMRSGMTIWTDKTDIRTGTTFSEAINQGIEGADNLVYLMSPDSLESEYCQRELAHAFANNKRIIPLLIEEMDLEAIPSQVRELHFINLIGHEDADKYQNGVDKLLAELKKKPSYYEKQKTLLVKALKWQRQNRNPSLLLRGYNLQQFEAWLKVARPRDDYPPLPIQEEFITASLNKPEEASLEVFISYSRTDSDLARKLNDGLQELGKTTWFDQESIATGTDFKQEIYRGIESSDNFLFIISPKSVNSPYCVDEVEYAQKLGKRFVTILHRKLSAVDKKNLPPALASVQWLDFNQHGGEFAANFNELVRTLDTDREHVVNHTKWSQRALEWQEKGGEERLLRGSELAIAENWLEEADKNNKQPPATELQKKFIGNSVALRDREHKQRARAKRLTFSGLAGGLVLALGLTGFALWQWHQSVIAQIEILAQSSELFLTSKNQPFDALIASLKAGKLLQRGFWVEEANTRIKIVSSLQEAISTVREYNRLERHNESVTSLSISPDGRQLASASEDKTIKFWDVATGKLLNTITDTELDSLVMKLTFSPDSKTLVSISYDRKVRFWDVATGKSLKTPIRCGNNRLWGASLSPDGKTLAVSDRDTIKLCDVNTGKLLHTLTGHNDLIRSISFSPNGRQLASGSQDKTIKLWDVTTGKLINTIAEHKSSVMALDFSHDGKTLASASETIKFWDVTKSKPVNIPTWGSSASALSFSPDGRQLASGSEDKTIKIWDVATSKLLNTLTGHGKEVLSVSFSPNGQQLASGNKYSTEKKATNI